MTLLLEGGTVVDPTRNLADKASVLIEKGRIAAVGDIQPNEHWKRIDVSGLVVSPGLIDMHVHLREPGREDKETIETGSRAAVAGGFTSVACMPNTSPVNDCEAVTRFILDKAKKTNLANVFPVGAVTKGSQGKELAEIGEMVKAGAVAITDDGQPVQNNQVMRRALEYARIFDIPVLDHCEDVDLAASGCMNESAVSTELGLRGLNRSAEELHVLRDIVLTRLTKSRVHICHISTAESLEWVRQAKKRGIAVTCEVAPHHFTLTDKAVKAYDTNFKMKPPLRTQEDVDAMLEGLSDGTIDCIATDHAPHNQLDKEVPFEEAENGVIGLESALPLACEFLLRKEVVTLPRLVALMSVNPSRILSLERGTLKDGAIADLTIFDPEAAGVIDVSGFRSKARNCPFDGWEVHGRVAMTIAKGRPVWRDKGRIPV
jgi:dihydroorotase